MKTHKKTIAISLCILQSTSAYAESVADSLITTSDWDYRTGKNQKDVSVGIIQDTAKATAGAISGTASTILGAPGRMFNNVSDNQPPMLSKGTQEFGISGNLNFADDFAYNLDLTYGWFIQDNWQVGFTASTQGVDDDLSFGLGLFTEYNFSRQNSKWVPFVGLSAEWARLDSDFFDESSISLGLDLGLKYFIRENIALSFSIGADFAFDDVFPGGDDFQQQINIGTRFYF